MKSNKFAILVHLIYFDFACKTISRRAARRLIVLHPKQNIESELKWQKNGKQLVLARCQKNLAVRQGKGERGNISCRRMQNLDAGACKKMRLKKSDKYFMRLLAAAQLRLECCDVSLPFVFQHVINNSARSYMMYFNVLYM